MLHAPAHRSQFNAFTVEATTITIKSRSRMCCAYGSVRGEQPQRERTEFICGLWGGNQHNDVH